MSDPSTASRRLNVYTYHCLCSTHLLTTTHHIPSLARRAESALDKAFILPYRAVPTSSHSSTDGLTSHGFTSIASLKLPSSSSKAVVIQREDGFEKRWLARCGRCDLVVGYTLPWSQFADAAKPDEEQGGGASGDGMRADVLYILPGACVETGDMLEGRGMRGEEGLGVFAAA